jgi:poly(beta-D-mannuronate) lyase
VHDNYFHGLTGSGHESPLVLGPGAFDTETTDQILEKYRDFTTTPATRVAITRNTWINCTPLYIGGSKPDQELPFLPQNCTFTHNMVAHGTPMKSKFVRLGLVRDFTATDNVAYGAQAPAEAWAAWFKWEQASSVAIDAKPKLLSPADVGPDAKGD